VYGTSEVPRVGATVTVSGEYVHLNQVTLDWPPAAVSPLLVGARGPKTVAITVPGTGPRQHQFSPSSPGPPRSPCRWRAHAYC
jgi:hypothetical protein